MTQEEIIEAYIAASVDECSVFEDAEAQVTFSAFHFREVVGGEEAGAAHEVCGNVVAEAERAGAASGRVPRVGESAGAKTRHGVGSSDQRCVCCQTIDFISPVCDGYIGGMAKEELEGDVEGVSVFAGKKYKPVGLKTRPVYTELPEQYRIKREIMGDPLEGLPKLNPRPKHVVPSTRYDAERMAEMEQRHAGFLWKQELMLLHEFVKAHEEAFAWTAEERGTFRHDFFPPVEFPVVEHETWVEKTIPIPRGQLAEFCKVIKNKIDAGVYEPSNASYRSKFFGVVKKDGKSLRLVHALEPLNAVTIAHSGLPPATEELANHFAGRACGGCLELGRKRTSQRRFRRWRTNQTRPTSKNPVHGGQRDHQDLESVAREDVDPE
uniref:Reverse transcriptase/retrotransposon-derived protein RNase H-like domain-containing protein n=1 Tax=Mycena chlorophos TaxID=658473 RepID=A0ABQ0LE81_MYCCL|nr:predicted protein [Mycena chlorophos]